jgi:hypothetical protein
MDVHLIPDTAGGFVALLASHQASESPHPLLYQVTRADMQSLGTGRSEAGISLSTIISAQRGSVLFSDDIDTSEQGRCAVNLQNLEE